MKYVLKIDALGKYPEINLSEDEYKSLKIASEKLSNGLAIEEKYEILISNYLDFEVQLLEHAAQAMIRIPYDYDYFFQVRMSFNRRLVNLLTSARLYIDQLHHHIRPIIPDYPNLKDELKRLFSKEYDSSLHYRFMEALRNYVQHRGIPVHWFQFNNHSDDSGVERLLIFTMELASLKAYLLEDDSFKKKVLEEIPDKIDLKMATRAYIEGISRIHSSARNFTENVLKESRAIIENAIISYKKIHSDNCIGLHAICFDDNKIIDRVMLLLEWDDIRLKLNRCNSELINLRRRYVSGQTKNYDK